MSHPLAGKPAPESLLVNIPRLVTSYFAFRPDPGDISQRVSFGTSGHRGSSLDRSFNEAHILAICQAICDYRVQQGITGPLYLGIDTHALSEPALVTATEVFIANEVSVHIQTNFRPTPTPVISHAILSYNRGRSSALADGVVITPSHNPPRDGGFKYNPPHGGPAEGEITGDIQAAANAYLEADLAGVRRTPFQTARDQIVMHDYITPYVAELASAIDMEAIRSADLKIGVDPMGGSGIDYWAPIAERYGLNIEVVNHRLDPTFSFMRLDHDGKIRMDCSSPFAMAGLIDLREQFDIAFGNDPDYDRHGIVTKQAGLLNPNHFLAVAIDYLFDHRPDWPSQLQVGKTLVSSAMIDRVAAAHDRTVCEVPVGFKWFVTGLLESRFAFGGEESAGASFLRRDGSTWTTDKDGILLDLLAAEITAVTGRDPSEHYRTLTERFGTPVYARTDAPATREQKAALKELTPDAVTATSLAGDPITAVLTHAPGNNAAIGGLKVASDHGWFAARPSGTEAIYKIYAESFRGSDHLHAIQEAARGIVDAAFGG